MPRDLVPLLDRLWQHKANSAPDGYVTYGMEGEAAKRDVRAALAEMREVLIVRLDAIGDNFLFQDSLRKLKSILPQADITIATYQENRRSTSAARSSITPGSWIANPSPPSPPIGRPT